MRRFSVEAPHLAVPSLAGGDGVDVDDELVFLMNISDNQLTLLQRRRPPVRPGLACRRRARTEDEEEEEEEDEEEEEEEYQE